MISSKNHTRQSESSRRDESYTPSLNNLVGIENALSCERRLRFPNGRQWGEGSSSSRHYSNTSFAFSATDTMSTTQPSEQLTISTFPNDENREDRDGLSEIEALRKFRFLERPDVKYLGFTPSRNDKRPYLNAIPVVGRISDGEYASIVYPVSSAQIWSWIIFCVFIALVGTGSYFYIRNILNESLGTRENFSNLE